MCVAHSLGKGPDFQVLVSGGTVPEFHNASCMASNKLGTLREAHGEKELGTASGWDFI